MSCLTVMSCSQDCHNVTSERNLESEALIEDELNWKTAKMLQIKKQSMAIVENVDELEKLFNEPPKTVFDFDLSDAKSNESRKNLLKCVMSLTPGSNKETFIESDIFKLLLSSYSERQITFLELIVTHLMNVCNKNQFTLSFFDKLEEGKVNIVKVGNVLLPFASLINHSCDPNIFWISVDTKFVFLVAKPIKAGEQLFQCYG